MITEAIEAGKDKASALRNLAYQVRTGETMGVIGMYEQAAYWYGATAEEVNAVLRQSRRAP